MRCLPPRQNEAYNFVGFTLVTLLLSPRTSTCLPSSLKSLYLFSKTLEPRICYPLVSSVVRGTDLRSSGYCANSPTLSIPKNHGHGAWNYLSSIPYLQIFLLPSP